MGCHQGQRPFPRPVWARSRGWPHSHNRQNPSALHSPSFLRRVFPETCGPYPWFQPGDRPTAEKQATRCMYHHWATFDRHSRGGAPRGLVVYGGQRELDRSRRVPRGRRAKSIARWPSRRSSSGRPCPRSSRNKSRENPAHVEERLDSGGANRAAISKSRSGVGMFCAGGQTTCLGSQTDVSS